MPFFNCPARPFAVRFARSFACLLAAATPCVSAVAATGGVVSATVQGRYIVVYRGGTVPEDAEQRLGRMGARMLHRHERFGMVSVATDATGRQRLLHDSAVEYVLQDRVVTGTRVVPAQLNSKLDETAAGRLTRVAPAGPVKVLVGPVSAPVTVTPTAPVATTPVTQPPVTSTPVSTPTTTPVKTSPVTTTPAAPASTADTYYSGSQGWAVKAAGGYGMGVAGGTVHGAWNTTLGQGVRIAVLDSGVDAQHPDIAPNLALNITEIDTAALPSACDDGTPQDQQGHGTWVASLAAGAMGSSTGRVVGMAPGATILNIKVLQRLPGAGTTLAAQCTAGEASGLVSWLLKGIDDAVAQHADVIVLSLGSIVDLYSGDGAGMKVSFDRVTHAAANAGVVMVAAAGNDGFDLSNTRYVSLPAQARDVLAVVASTNPDCKENTGAPGSCVARPMTRPYYSNYGAPLNAVAAPGGDLPLGPDEGVSGFVRGACTNSKPGTADGLPANQASMGCFNLGHQQYVQAIGTSASAPLVAGVAALVKAAHPGWDAATIAGAIRSSARTVPTMAVPLVDAGAAVAWVQ